jgi:enoyl-CoA hydratase
MRTDAPASGIAIERTDGAWLVTLDRPDKANALSRGLVDALIAAVGEAEREGARVLVFRGNGRNLSAGFDFGGFEDQGEAELAQRFVRIEMLLQAVARSRCLTVAFAHGRNFGAGADLFAACRWRIGAPQATFRMPGLAFGVVLGTRRFAALVGRERARALLEGLETFDAVAARDMGFVTRVAEEAAWETIVAEAIAMAGRLPDASRAALYRTLDDAEHDRDLADLVRSVSAPGLKDRMRAYVGAREPAKA